MRRFLLILAVVLFLPATADAGTLFVIDGRGWGHGVGMSQFGARGYAEAGWSHQRILAHFYRGTELRIMPARPVRVLLAEGRPAVRISSTKPFKVDRRGQVAEAEAGAQNVVAGEARRSGGCRSASSPAPRRSARRQRLPRRARSSTGARGRSHGRQPAPARSLPPRSRALGDAGRLASRGAAGAGGRRPLLRARDAEAGQRSSTSTPTLAARSTAVSRPRT